MTGIELLSPIPGPLKYQSASPCSLGDQRSIDARPNDLQSHDWVVPEFKIFEHDEHGKPLLPTRVLALTPGYLAFELADLLYIRPILDAFGQFLPIQTNHGQRWYLRPSLYLDGFLADESRAKYSGDGSRVIWFKEIVIRNPEVDSIGAFKVSALSRSPVLYRPDIVEKLLSTGLFVGVEFTVKGRALA